MRGRAMARREIVQVPRRALAAVMREQVVALNRGGPDAQRAAEVGAALLRCLGYTVTAPKDFRPNEAPSGRKGGYR